MTEWLDDRSMWVPPSTCKLWILSGDKNGYGQAYPDGHTITKAHRLAYEVHKGLIPPGLFVLHTCDEPACVNPDHLVLGTLQDNHADMMRKRRARGRFSGIAPTTRKRSRATML